MMSDTVAYILRALQSGLAGYGTLYVVSAICWPSWFLDTLAVNHVRARFDRAYRLKHPNHHSVYERPWHEIPLGIFTLIAVGVLVHAASYALIAVVPFSWGGENEDGEWEATRQSLQYLIAFLAPVAIVGKLEANAEILAWAPAERKARSALTDAIRFARHLSPDAKASISTAVDQALELEDGPETFARRYTADLRRRVGGDITG